MENKYKTIEVVERLSREKEQTFYENHKAEFNEFIERYGEEDLCLIANEINEFKWNTELLGDYKGAVWAVVLMDAINLKIGRYKILKYAHLKFHKGDKSYCKTEAEFDRYCIETLFNESQIYLNPLRT